MATAQVQVNMAELSAQHNGDPDLALAALSDLYDALKADGLVDVPWIKVEAGLHVRVEGGLVVGFDRLAFIPLSVDAAEGKAALSARNATSAATVR